MFILQKSFLLYALLYFHNFHALNVYLGKQNKYIWKGCVISFLQFIFCPLLPPYRTEIFISFSISLQLVSVQSSNCLKWHNNQLTEDTFILRNSLFKIPDTEFAQQFQFGCLLPHWWFQRHFLLLCADLLKWIGNFFLRFEMMTCFQPFWFRWKEKGHIKA